MKDHSLIRVAESDLVGQSGCGGEDDGGDDVGVGSAPEPHLCWTER